jgi:hypothetical protein
LFVVELDEVFHHTNVDVLLCAVTVGIVALQSVSCVAQLYTSANVHETSSYDDNAELFQFTAHANNTAGVLVCA